MMGSAPGMLIQAEGLNGVVADPFGAFGGAHPCGALLRSTVLSARPAYHRRLLPPPLQSDGRAGHGHRHHALVPRLGVGQPRGARHLLQRAFDRQLLFTGRVVLMLFTLSVMAFALSSNSSMYDMVQNAHKVTLVAGGGGAGVPAKRATVHRGRHRAGTPPVTPPRRFRYSQ